ncbi:hypothetical protein KC343_g12167 [Hortaea werneckii]|nr:hypothetical protein KC323_g7609 [Hortaea werneckii]KAI6859608.1 hypothetical protein KC338_g7265 [Hortaea werneckii]KAI7159651.1 hypothetical protein KC352_g27080 [Hortaea werneckii]KAI7354884.1 hypothetical protein KC320_g3143 [Hortaea werneckii]KAI7567151.1 hypothetical protein KC317_g5183 [Hortaea werneckii]
MTRIYQAKRESAARHLDGTSKPRPTVHPIYSETTGTWQYVVADPTTSLCVVIDSVRDRRPDQAAISTSAADALLALIKKHNYTTSYILETNNTGSGSLSAAWYIRMQLSMTQQQPPQLLTDSGVPGLEAMWHRKYGTSMQTTIRSSLSEGESLHIGNLCLSSMEISDGGSLRRRAYRIGDELFGACPDAESNSATRKMQSTSKVRDDGGEVTSSKLLRILPLPRDARIWHTLGHGICSQRGEPFDYVCECVSHDQIITSPEGVLYSR